MMTKPLLGLLGILIAASTAELNDVVTSIALVDVRGAFGISYDPGTWIQSLYAYTKIPAPVDGMIAARSVEVGNTVSPGATLMTVVPLAQVYIIANYREVDLRHVRAGQRVTIHLDAYNIDLDGTVNGIGAASGVSFSPIQPNNATGNFTKIVQRLPVKIDVNPNQPLAQLLRVGLSVETTIHTALENIVDEQRQSTSRVTEH